MPAMWSAKSTSNSTEQKADPNAIWRLLIPEKNETKRLSSPAWGFVIMNSLIRSVGILSLSIATADPVFAQAPGVPIELNGNRKQDAGLLAKAKVLKDAGKLKLSIAIAKEQLKAPQPALVDFPAPRTQSLSGREIARAAREGHIQFGWYYLCKNCDNWHLNLAGAYAVAKDTIATCHHCVEPNDDMREGFLVAVDYTGEVLPVNAVLAKSQSLDGAILRVEGGKFIPLAFSDSISPGDSAYCYSSPLGQSGYFSEGIVNRFFWNGAPGKAGAPGQWKNLRVNVSTDWAPGSSGAAILDQAGNVIGHVSTIHPLSEGPRPVVVAPDKDKKDEKKQPVRVDRFGGATLITLHDATPARGMLELGKPLRDFKPSDAVALEKNPPKVDPGELGSVKVGLPAPELQTGKWVQGEPVKAFEKGKVYIVEFWATWCGPCRATIPHLNALHKKFADKGVIVIAQNCWEQDTEKVAPFLKEMGDKMTYRVALDAVEGDDPNTGAMATKWMQAAGQKGIPSAFLVDQKGTVAWIGHPSQLTEPMLEEVLAGKFDVAKAKTDADETDKMRDAMMRHGSRAATAIAKKDWDGAQKAVGDLENALPATRKYVADALRFKIALGRKDTSAANESAQKIAAASGADSPILNEVAWELLTSKALDKPDIEIAEKLARRGVETAVGQSKPAVMDTLARALFRTGKKDDAIKLQEEAIGSAEDEKLKSSLTKTLEAYKRGEIPPEE